MSSAEEEFLSVSPQARISMVGHRQFVGGNDTEFWYGIGKLQYHFLVANGLKHSDIFLDVACGSLRLGQYLIPYLDEGCYRGIDGEPDLVRLGLENEFFADIIEKKKPRFAFNYDFDFSFADRFDVAIAQSLFTHFTMADIGRCLEGLRSVAHADSRFFFTFFEGDSGNNPAKGSDPHLLWSYPFAEISDCAASAGWHVDYIGQWRHPRDQKIAVASLK